MQRVLTSLLGYVGVVFLLNACGGGNPASTNPNPTFVTPTITWAMPVPITYGTALSTSQLNATANYAGIFTYSPASGTMLAAGTHTLTATFATSDHGQQGDTYDHLGEFPRGACRHGAR
jgi:hypothetical protein